MSFLGKSDFGLLSFAERRLSMQGWLLLRFYFDIKTVSFYFNISERASKNFTNFMSVLLFLNQIVLVIL